jgi:hypothetical protein
MLARFSSARAAETARLRDELQQARAISDTH